VGERDYRPTSAMAVKKLHQNIFITWNNTKRQIQFRENNEKPHLAVLNNVKKNGLFTSLLQVVTFLLFVSRKRSVLRTIFPTSTRLIVVGAAYA